MPVPGYMQARPAAPQPVAAQGKRPAPAAPQPSVKDQLKQSAADKNLEVILF